MIDLLQMWWSESSLLLLGTILQVVIAVSAVLISIFAYQLQRTSSTAERARYLIDWAGKVLDCMSRAYSLGMYTHAEIDDENFRLQRRQVRSEMFALKNIGEMLRIEYPNSVPMKSLEQITVFCDSLNGSFFLPPKVDGSKTERRGRADFEMRQAMKIFKNTKF